jgi:predicted ATPase
VSNWTIDLERSEVRDASGKHARLRRRQFDVLMCLARQHDRLVSKEALIAAGWRGLAVSDDSLTKCISEIRQILGPGLRENLRTLSGRGYMLTGWQADEAGRILSGAGNAHRPGHLPAARPLVGRDADVDHLTSLIERTRLVTIAGPGGVGKTSLAVAVANGVAASFDDGACFVPLAPVLTTGSVAAAIMAALHLVVADGDPLAAVLAEVMDRRMLLVLDNCEHVVDDAAMVVSQLLAKSPRLAVLTTSREPLSIEGEATFRLQPLACPLTADGLDAQSALGYPAVRLLVRRAELAQDGFALGDADVPAAVEICKRLDGIPLAIVLAAAQLRAMQLDEVARRLDRRFELLAGGPRDAGERQATLRAMVAWSVDLLSAPEQELFAQLGVFGAPVTAEDIIAVCRIGSEPPVISQIVSLTDKSLLNVRHAGGAGPTRYGYFETTRHLALERLGDGNAVHRRHASHLTQILRRAESELEVSSTESWRNAYRPYLGELQAALAWCNASAGDAKLALELAARGATLFDELSFVRERRALVERAAAMPDVPDEPALRGRLMLWQALRTSWIVWDGGLAHTAASLFVRSREPLWEGRARAMAAVSDAFGGAWEQVLPGFDAAEQLLRPFGPTRSLSNMLRYKATMLIWQGQLSDAEPILHEAVEVADAVGYFTGSVRGRATLGEVALERGDMVAAIRSTTDELAEVSKHGSLSDVQSSLTFLAAFRLLANEIEAGADALRQVFAIDRRLADTWATCVHIELTGFYLALRGDMTAAMSLTAFARTANLGTDRPAERFEQFIRARVEQLFAPLPSELRREAEAEAKGWLQEHAVTLAIRKLAPR